jgi:signal peptidase II
MNISPRKSALLSLAFGFDAFLLDRVHKFFQLNIEGWTGGEVVPVTGFFNYILIWNTGVSYGFLTGAPKVAIFSLIGIAIVLLGWWWLREKSFLVRSGLAIVLGGAISNATDRWLYGGVADFFHFYVGERSFYVFNLADVAISFGAGLLILDVFLPKDKRNV